MTKEQFNKAKEFRDEIAKYDVIIQKIKAGITTKSRIDEIAKTKKGREHNERWTLMKFFTLKFRERKIALIPHYEFAQGIEMDAEPELVELIIDYLEKKKAVYEKEFERIGGAEHG